jgi:class 3 adenylate cyclase
MDQPRRRLSAVWFADIVGYTELSSRDEPAALALVGELQALARTIVEGEFEGRIVKFIGDALLAEFGSTDSAVKAAVALTERYVTASKGIGHPAQLHIGVHLGEVTATPDGDLYGDGINTAARLQHQAGPGQIIISEDVWRQLRQRPELSFASLGAVELKGITSQVQVFDVLFGARAALAKSEAAAAAALPAPKRTPAGVRRRGRKVAALAIGLSLVVAGVLAVVLIPRMDDGAGAGAGAAPPVATEPAADAPATSPIETPAAQPTPTGAVAAAQPEPEPRSSGPAASDREPAAGTRRDARASDARAAAPGQVLAAARGLIDEFAAALASDDPGPAVRRLYPNMPPRQAVMFRGLRQQFGGDVQVQVGRVDPTPLPGDTLGVRFIVRATVPGRPETPITFAGKIVGTPAGPRFAELARIAGR